MKTLSIQGSTGSSSLLVGERLGNLDKYLPRRPVFIITDTHVRRRYGADFPADVNIIEIGTGEENKTLDTVHRIYEQLVALEADRSAFIAGIGGGIVCDITGFVASTYMRGVRFGFVATTLLSQVDASVGGKNGVNFSGFKNMVGVFSQPEFVICDMEMLRTLPKPEILCGFGEIVKHGLIADEPMLRFLEENTEKALELDAGVIERLVYDSVRIKSDIVNQDEKESGERRKLNFGHTFGHAVEKVARVPHGQAVSIGMMVAARLSERRRYISAADVSRIRNLLERLGLPVDIRMDAQAALDALRRDKKRQGDYIHFVLLRTIGEAVVEEIPITELEAVIHELHAC